MEELRLIEIKNWMERYGKSDVYSGHEENWATEVAATTLLGIWLYGIAWRGRYE